jgi:hypothetical protein
MFVIGERIYAHPVYLVGAPLSQQLDLSKYLTQLDGWKEYVYYDQQNVACSQAHFR